MHSCFASLVPTLKQYSSRLLVGAVHLVSSSGGEPLAENQL